MISTLRRLARDLKRVRYAADAETVQGIVRSMLDWDAIEAEPSSITRLKLPSDVRDPGSVWRGVLADAVQEHTDDEDFAERIRNGEYGVDWYVPRWEETPVKGAHPEFIPVNDRHTLERFTDTLKLQDDKYADLISYDLHPETARHIIHAVRNSPVTKMDTIYHLTGRRPINYFSAASQAKLPSTLRLYQDADDLIRHEDPSQPST